MQSLRRAFQLLDAIGSREVGVSEVARELGLSKSTAFRLLSTLREVGYLQQDPETDRYRLGLRLLELGQIVAGRLDLPRVALPTMLALARQSQATVFLAVLQDGIVTNVEQVESSAPLRVVAEGPEFRRIPHSIATGKVLLAALPAQERETMLRTLPLVPLTPNSIVSREQLGEALEAVRRQGYAINDEEQVLGVRGVAAPVYDRRERVVAALSIAAPATQLSRELLPTAIDWVCRSAAEVSANLGAPRAKHMAAGA